MNLPVFRLSKPSFSPRFFIYVLFLLVILILIAEGTYFFILKKKTSATVLSDEFGTIVNEGIFTTWTSIDKAQKFTSITGQVKRIEGRTLFIASIEKPNLKNNLVKVVLSEDVDIAIHEGEFSPDNPEQGLTILSPASGVHGEKFVKGDIGEIPLGSVIIATNVKKAKDSFLTDYVFLAKPREQ